MRASIVMPDVGPGDLLPLPHLIWPEELGERAASDLAARARSLLVRFADRKREQLVDAAQIDAYVGDHARLVEDTFGWLRAAPPLVRSHLTEWTERMFTSLDTHAEHRVGTDPFAALHDVADPSDSLPGAAVAAWPFLAGHAMHAAERDLRLLPRRRRRVHAATWGALVGVAYLWSRRSFAAARQGIQAVVVEPDLRHDGVVAGGALLVNQRAVVRGFRDARAGRRAP